MAKMIDEDIIDRVNDATDIVDLVSDYVELKQSGSNFLGLCPFHNEKTPSFSVSASKQFYHCFGCGVGGDAIDFLMKLENISFLEAVERLAEKNGILIEEYTEKDMKLRDEKDRILSMNKEAARFFYNSLTKDPGAKAYLEKRAVKAKTINAFGMGYADESWDSLLNFLRSKNYEDKEIFEAGLAGIRRDGKGYYDRFRNRIIFPIINARGEVIGFGGRELGEAMPKYLNSQETKVFHKGDNLYNLNLISKLREREKLVLVEGYMDVVGLHNEGIRYSVASLGTALTENQAKLLKRYAKNIYICYDSDTAGRNASLKALEILKDLGTDPKVVVLPDGMDPDDFVREEGAESFQYLLKKSLNYLDYHIYINKFKYNLLEADGKIAFTQEIAKMIRRLASPIEKEVYIDKISVDTGISREAIWEETRRLVDEKRGPAEDPNKSSFRTSKVMASKLEPGYLRAEKTLIKLSMENREDFSFIRDGLEGNLLYTDNLIKLFQIIEDLYDEDKDLTSLDFDDLRDRFPQDQVLNEIDRVDLGLLLKREENIISMINLINRTKREKERDDLLLEIKSAEENKDRDLLGELTLKLIEINKDLNKMI